MEVEIAAGVKSPKRMLLVIVRSVGVGEVVDRSIVPVCAPPEAMFPNNVELTMKAAAVKPSRSEF